VREKSITFSKDHYFISLFNQQIRIGGTLLPSKNLLKGIKYENKEGVTGTLSAIYQ
jgi:hypothetical protein